MADKEIDWGGSAFPCEGGPASNLYPDPGMSLRDYIATHAMQAALATSKAENEEALLNLFKKVADLSYAAADAMIEARKETK